MPFGPATGSRIRGCRHPDAGDLPRREHRHLHGGAVGAAEIAALSRVRSPRLLVRFVPWRRRRARRNFRAELRRQASDDRRLFGGGALSVVGLPRGREITPRVVIVDEQLARRFWPDQDPVGRRMYLPDSPEDVAKPGPKVTWLRVVGVVGTVKLKGLEEGSTHVRAPTIKPMRKRRRAASRGRSAAARTRGLSRRPCSGRLRKSTRSFA